MATCVVPPCPQLSRPQRFPASYQGRLEALVMSVADHIFWKNKEMPEETRRANQAVAMFVKVSLNYYAPCLDHTPSKKKEKTLDVGRVLRQMLG